MKIDPFAPQLLRDYVDFTTKHGFYPFPDYILRWYTLQALIEAAEADGNDPFALTVEDLEAALPFVDEVN